MKMISIEIHFFSSKNTQQVNINFDNIRDLSNFGRQQIEIDKYLDANSIFKQVLSNIRKRTFSKVPKAPKLKFGLALEDVYLDKL